jgi:hypothetical protein
LALVVVSLKCLLAGLAPPCGAALSPCHG